MTANVRLNACLKSTLLLNHSTLGNLLEECQTYRPASANALPNAQKQRGVNSEPFDTVVFPVAIAVAAARTPKTYGAFLK